MVEDREEAEPHLEQREEHGGGPEQHKLGNAVQTEWDETTHSMLQCQQTLVWRVRANCLTRN